ENMIESYLHRKNSPIDMEEVLVPEHSWLRFKKIKDARLRELTNVSIVGIKDENGKFVAMPNKDLLIGTNSSLLLVGTSENIASAKRVIKKKNKPEEIKYV
ncbi:MAG: TrkA C-terminal domain-containing protein, partial [Sulfurospirillaceae bacterium]|nr:TrkA C-terminal domain-containing protein [Sulfurospirillaceae bacterium]